MTFDVTCIHRNQQDQTMVNVIPGIDLTIEAMYWNRTTNDVGGEIDF
jgi:hypothetical protein